VSLNDCLLFRNWRQKHLREARFSVGHVEGIVGMFTFQLIKVNDFVGHGMEEQQVGKVVEGDILQTRNTKQLQELQKRFVRGSKDSPVPATQCLSQPSNTNRSAEDAKVL
jgi:hypothetical protein